MSSIWYIHGANASANSFAWLKDQLPKHSSLDIEYDNSRSVMMVVDMMVDRLLATPEPVVLMGHSLGGLIALNVAHRSKSVSKVVTMASPLGGCGIASILRWLMPCPLFADIHPASPLVVSLQKPIPIPTLSLVATTGGTPFLTEANDGVVTVSSQMKLVGPIYERLPVNHYEILLAAAAVSRIVDFVFQ